ncbi:MAG: acetamidase/formamidase family protein [Actinobacteria bacterium]|nr:acetamidase/formamidase family protein [Actinomycetota bacterium]
MGRKHGRNTVGDDGRHDGPVPHPRVDPGLLPPPLHTGTGPVLGETYVTATPTSLRWGRLPTPDTAPIATIRPGSTITFDTVSHEGLLGDQGADPIGFFGGWGIPADAVLDDVAALTGASLDRDLAHDGPHVVVGPVTVEGARPGDVLCVETIDLALRLGYGIVSNRHGRGVLAGEMPAATQGDDDPEVVSVLATVEQPGRGRIVGPSGHAVGFDLRPFLGLVGVTPAGEEVRSSTPPGPFGGNLDIRHLGVGSRLLLPVQVDGAGLYVGDPHYAQGDGEVALTAFEAPLRATLRVSLLTGPDARQLASLLRSPWGEVGGTTILVGLGDTLDGAMRACVRRAVDYVDHVTGIGRAEALAFLSAAVDFQVSQAVNLTVGVHCLIRDRDLRP